MYIRINLPITAASQRIDVREVLRLISSASRPKNHASFAKTFSSGILERSTCGKSTQRRNVTNTDATVETTYPERAHAQE